MRMKKFVFITVLIIVLFHLFGCKENEKISELLSVEGEEEEKTGQLLIYMNATTHSFRSYAEDGSEVYTTIYPSRYTTGTMLSAGDVDSPNCNIIEKAVSEYAEKKNMQVEIRYLGGLDSEEDVLQELVNSGEKLPDLLIFNTQPHYDYYRLAEQGYLLDFLPYVTNDDAINNEELYYQRVLDGGEIYTGQYAIPLLFSMNAMMTTEEYLGEIGSGIPTAGNTTYEELLFIMEDSCIEMADNNSKQALHETSGSMLLGHFLPSILTAAAYPSYIDDSGDIIVSADTLSDIFQLMTYYNRQEFTPIVGWEDNSYIENMNTGLSKSYMIPFSADANDYIGILLSGGRSGGVGFYSSLLTDAAFMQTVYEDKNEQFVFCGVPTLENSTAYSANITLAAYGMATTEHPQEVYDLVRFLMDYEFPYQYGFSVNKEITEKQITNAQRTTISVYPEYIWEGHNEIMDQDELSNLIFHTDPLSAENAAIIQNMLDNIAGAGLPYGVLEYNMYNSMLNMVGDGKMTPSEAGEWVITQWNQYLDQLDKWEPFYDLNFSNSIRLYGDLPEEE